MELVDILSNFVEKVVDELDYVLMDLNGNLNETSKSK